MRRILALLLLLAPSIALAASPITVPSIAALRAGNFLNSPSVQITSWYAGLNKGGGILTYDSTDTTTADNSCTVFVDGASHRFKRPINGPLDVTMCGVKADGSTNDAAAFNLAYVAASTTPLKTLTAPCGTIKVNSTITTAQGVSIRGCGMGTASNSPLGQTKIDASALSVGWVFDINTPNGTTLFEAPKYYDMAIIAHQSDVNAGGCIRWNNIANGFTDDNTSQYYMLHPHAERIFCEVNSGLTTQQIGIQCNKCFDGDISQSDVFFGAVGIDLEGSDIVSIGGAGGNRVQGAVSSLILLQQRGTFGNKDRVVGNELLYPTDFGQTVTCYICDNGESTVIDSNHIEGIIPTATSVIKIAAGYNHVIQNNDIDVAGAANWLWVDTDLTALTVTGNGCAGCILNVARFQAGTLYYYNNGGVRQIITHSGNNGNADSGFPFNSIGSTVDSIIYPPTVALYASPSTDGLTGNGIGLTVKVGSDSAFVLNPGGSTNYLDFNAFDIGVINGTFDIIVNASSPIGGTSMSCAVTDNNSVVTGYTTVNITSTTRKQYTFATAATTTTRAGFRCYANGTNAMKLYYAELVYH
jgi:hypothetical protein